MRGVSYPAASPSARLVITRCLNPLAQSPEADRILILRLGAVGDVVRTLPAASNLRAAYPGAHLAWLVEPAAASALTPQPWLDEVIVFPRPALVRDLRRLALAPAVARLKRFLQQLRRRRFDLVVDFHSLLRSAVLGLASGAAQRVGYARPFGRELSYLLATHLARLAPDRVSRFERNAGLMDYLGVSARALPTPFRVDPGLLARTRIALGPGPAPVAIHPGSSDTTAHKRFPIEEYAEVARVLSREDGTPVIVTRGPARDDRALAEALVKRAAGAARLAPPTPTLAELAAVLAASRLYVGADTGPLHVASLVGTPVVQLLGPTDPVENAPYPATPSRTLCPGVGHEPGRRAMADIPAAAVVAAARELLGEGELLARAGGCG